MSSTDDASSRLSNALDEIFRKAADPTLPPRSGRGDVPATAEPTADWSVDDDEDRDPYEDHGDDAERGHDAGVGVDDRQEVAPTERYVLPEIVPATEPPPTEPPPTEPPPISLPPSRAGTAPAATRPAGATTPATPPTTSWGDHMAPTTAGPQLRAPGRRPRVRRVTRVLRHIDPWSTFKVALLFSALAYVVLLTAGVLLWRVAGDTGTLDNVERWFTQFGWETFELDGGEIFHNAWIIGLFGVVAMTGGLVLLATLFNLVSDIVGGVRMTVLEEEVVERTISSTRRYVVRRGPNGEPGVATVAAQTWDVDGDDPVTQPEGAASDGPSAADAG